MSFLQSLIQPPIDGSTNEEIKNLIKQVLVTFTAYYVKNYTIQLVKKGIAEAQEEPGPDWKLLTRPPGDTKYLEGWVLKRAGFAKKSMQKRYFVVRPDYMIDYYLSEEEAKKENGKKKGTIALCGYWVNDDANKGMLQRLFKLAEKMGLDTSSVPKPTEFPPHTMELYHSRRKSYYIQLEDKQQFDDWLSQMKTCSWWVRGFKNKDPCHVAAFQEAIRQTRWKLGRWGWWCYGGTEEEILSDMIADELDYDIMGRIYAKMNGPWQARQMLRNQCLKIIDKLVIAAVTPAWKGMSSTVEAARPQIEPKIKESVAPIGELQKKMIDQIREACGGIITPQADQHVNPHLGKILAICMRPVTDAWNDTYAFFENECIGKMDTTKDDDAHLKAQYRQLDYLPWSWKMWDITRKCDELYEPLWALNIIFPDIWPWSLIYEATGSLKKKLDNAVYTFEQRLNTAKEAGGDFAGHIEATKQSVLADLKHDGDLQKTLYFRYILRAIVMPPLNKILGPLTEATLGPIQDAIPDVFKDLIDVQEMFDKVVNGIIDDQIDNSIRSAAAH